MNLCSSSDSPRRLAPSDLAGCHGPARSVVQQRRAAVQGSAKHIQPHTMNAKHKEHLEAYQTRNAPEDKLMRAANQHAPHVLRKLN